ncbi:MAG: AgmX/PglI C-terminal domain-containing protein [Myxococcales bacterium]|nr:AgmX/PglI C-terminal domain-containing protein [Myxococcales bacterium]
MAQAQQQWQAQKAHAPSPRILRIGVVLGGNIIEERLVRKRETITIGQSSKNSFSIPIEGLPRTFPVFSLENGKYFLNFQGNMDGRISAGGGVHTLSQLKNSGAQKRGDSWAVPLDERARGKVSVGAMTLLFQFVTAPPLPPRPRLPASVRGTLADRIEPRLAIILSCSVLTHFAIGLWAYTRDQVVERPVDKIARSFQVGQYDPPPLVEVAVVEPDEGDGEVTAEASGASTPKPNKPSRTRVTKEPTGGESGGNTGEGTPSDAAVDEAVGSTAMVSVLTGEGGAGGMFAKMSGTDQGASLADSIAHAKGKATATTGSGSGDRRQRGQGDGKLGTDKGGPGVAGPTGTEGGAGGAKKEDKIKSLTKFGRAEDLSLSDLDPNAVVKRIRGKYLAGIKRCHQRVLKLDPRAQGKVTIRFTVGPTGRVTKANVKGFDPTVDACIKESASKWRFSAPKDEGKPTSADFEVPLLLKPGAA